MFTNFAVKWLDFVVQFYLVFIAIVVCKSIVTPDVTMEEITH